MRVFIVLFVIFYGFVSSAQSVNSNRIIKVMIGKNQKIESLPAEITIKKGQISDSNCEKLSQSNPDKIKYNLKIKDDIYQCVPDRDYIERLNRLDLDFGSEVTIKALKDSIESPSKDYEIKKNISQSLFLVSKKPNCSLTNTGDVDWASCECSENFIFDLQSKSCAQSDNILSFYKYNCDSNGANTIFEMFAVDLIPPPEVTFGACFVDVFQYRVLPNITIYKMLYLNFSKEEILKQVGGDRLYLSLSQPEIKEMENWLQSYTSSEFPDDFIDRVNRTTESSLKAFLSDRFLKTDE